MSALIDLGRVGWLMAVLAVSVWGPAAVAARAWRPPAATICTQLITTMCLTVIAVSILAPLRLLNPFTLALTYGSWPVARWIVAHRGRLAWDVQRATRLFALACVRQFESSRHRVRVPKPAAMFGPSGVLHRFDLLFAVAVLALLGPDMRAAFSNTRLPGPAAYADLVTVEQLLEGGHDWAPPNVAASLATALSMVSAIAPVHVIRFAPPMIAAAFVVAVMLIVRRITGLRTLAMLCAIAAAAAMPHRTAPLTAQLAWVAAIAAFYCWHAYLIDGRMRQRTAVTATALATVTAPPLLGVIALGVAAVLLFPERWRSRTSSHPISNHDAGLRALVAAATIGVLMIVPRTAAARYVEYDAAARQTLHIANSLPRYRWMIVAPIEERALVYGRGWHMNLHDFVADVGPRAGDPAYRLPYGVDEVFVFVETRPFATFATEPGDVRFEQLADPVYRHYRSPAGRASLQYAAHRICEQLRQTGHSATITYDDGRLRIYRFTLR